MDKDN